MTVQSRSPRALIHKRILAAAENRPSAPFGKLAQDVSGASEELVERVLDEYGDPADEQPADDRDQETAMSANTDPIDLDTVTEEQKETLQAVKAEPDATQREIADRLGIAAATVSQRLSSIEGFDWEDRGRIVAETFDLHETSTASTETEHGESSDAVDTTESPVEETATTTETEASDTGGETDSTDESSQNTQNMTEAPDKDSDTLERRIVSIEHRLDELETTIETKTAQLETNIEETVTDGGKMPDSTGIEDPTLVAKLIRAAVADDAITEDEEVKIIEELH